MQLNVRFTERTIDRIRYYAVAVSIDHDGIALFCDVFQSIGAARNWAADVLEIHAGLSHNEARDICNKAPFAVSRNGFVVA